jgi:hypothetical protein
MSEWWVGRRGADPVGPVSTETLVRGVREKKVPPNALVCRVGGQQWEHITQVAEVWERINADATGVVEQHHATPVADSMPAADSLADADADSDDAATRILDGTAMQALAANAGPTRARPADAAAESMTVPLAMGSTLRNTAASSTSGDSGTAHELRPVAPTPAPAKAAAPAFRAPVALGKKSDAQGPSSQAGASAGGGLKETARLPKAVIPAPRFGVDRTAPASSIAAGPCIGKPPSVHPGLATKSSPPPASPASVRRGAVPPRVAPKPQIAEKSRQPIPPVPAAVIPLPPDTELAAMLRENENVSLTETRPDRRSPRDTGSGQSKPVNRQVTTPVHAVAKSTTGAAQKASDRPPAPRPAIGRTTAEQVPPLEGKPIVAVTDPDDDEATVIRSYPPEPLPPDEDWVVPESPALPVSEPPSQDEDATVVRHHLTSPISMPQDEDATIIRDAHPLPPVSVGARTQGNPSALENLEKPATHLATVRIADAAAEPHAPASVQAMPSDRGPAQNDTPPVGTRRPTPGAEPRELLDEDEDFLPARARDYAGAHGPPNTAEGSLPRPAAGTPAPPSVIVAPRQVNMDGLGRLPVVHTELTHPALRSFRPPGTIQISIATLIVGAMSLIVLVLAAVLLLR